MKSMRSVLEIPGLRASYTRNLSTRAYTSTSKLARNRIYNPVRYEEELESLLLLSASSRIPLITFWGASWCPSCKIVGPVIKELIDSGTGLEQGGVSFAEIEMDAPTIGGLAMRYQINSMPTLLAFDRQEAQLETKLTKVDDMKNKQLMVKWIEKEAERHGQGGGGGSGLFGALFGTR